MVMRFPPHEIVRLGETKKSSSWLNDKIKKI